jgi:hypothetical protein
MGNLAATYLKLGRYNEAVVLQEKTLRSMRHRKVADDSLGAPTDAL